MSITRATKSKPAACVEASAKSIEQLQNTVHKYCLSITKSGFEAEDLAQDAWLKALPTLADKDHANPEALLLRIAKTTWIDRSRVKDVRLKLLNESRHNDERPDSDFVELERAFRALLKHMPPLQRTVFMLRDVLGYSASDAARLLQTTEGAIKAALHRARKSLENVKRELSEETYIPYEDDALAKYVVAAVKAYQTDDLSALITLLQQDRLSPALAYSIAGVKLAGAGRTSFDICMLSAA